MWTQLTSQTGIMTRFIMKRDRVRLPIWLLSITLLTIITASSFTSLYETDQERQAIAETMRNPAMTAMVGPGYGLDNYTAGPMMAHQMLLFTAIVVALMNILLASRHTRTDEEEGRTELIRSLPVGRLTNISSTLIVMTGVNVVLALLIGLGLYSLQIESMNLEGSLLYGVTLGAIGFFFSGITALFAQVSESSRATIGYSFTVLGVAYLIRAIGDVSSELLSWFSPLGWIVRTEVFVTDKWGPIALTLGIAIIFIGLAFYLNTIRDLGSGFIPSKPGKKHATPLLQSPIGLALRLQRTGIIAWAVGMYILGASYGSVFGDLEAFFESNEMMSQLLTPVEGLSLTEQFLTMLMSVMAMICTVPTLMFLLKLKSEEKKGRSEHLLSRAVSRSTVLGSYFLISILLGAAMLALALIGLWSASVAVMDTPISFMVMFESLMVYLPAMWIMIGLGVLLIGILPQYTGFTWLYLGYSFLVVYLGGLLQFPEWMGKFSPYGHIPQLPVEEMNYLILAILTSVAVILTYVGFYSYRNRDLTS
ncbi:ABC transporter permease [Alkalihalobacillus sp. MEB130]|uniref:ABC transporter permease n=1 Tax=Alkalihalobacillus sp. MEB130 TaxID=2976704 RepID=UPI0028DDED6D|nr:ABC transporter permease [Alkalihalobacillus sp. MEB130]MDT8861209.1 ABC transporter permease [Alkalihalobacillus sp. MEB130]